MLRLRTANDRYPIDRSSQSIRVMEKDDKSVNLKGCVKRNWRKIEAIGEFDSSPRAVARDLPAPHWLERRYWPADRLAPRLERAELTFRQSHQEVPPCEF